MPRNQTSSAQGITLSRCDGAPQRVCKSQRQLLRRDSHQSCLRNGRQQRKWSVLPLMRLTAKEPSIPNWLLAATIDSIACCWKNSEGWASKAGWKFGAVPYAFHGGVAKVPHSTREPAPDARTAPERMWQHRSSKPCFSSLIGAGSDLL